MQAEAACFFSMDVFYLCHTMADDNTSVHNPHDRFFKSLMHNRETAIAFLEEFLPDEVEGGTGFAKPGIGQYDLFN